MRRSYGSDFKIEAVRLSYEPGQTVQKVASELGICSNSLSRWRGQFRNDPDRAFPGSGNPRDQEMAAEETTISAFTMAVERRRPAAGMIVHSDRGGQYRDTRYRKRHYDEHSGKPFFESLVEYMTSGPIVAMVVSGVDAICYLRRLCGATNPLEATPGTFRGDYALLTRLL